jgi:biotin transport system substrate-specific component
MLAVADKIQSNKTLEKVMPYLGCLALLALCFKVKIFLPFSPVPISMMNFGVIMVGALFPFRVALTCFLACLFEVFVGSPILGVAMPAGACFGYYVGMVVALFFLGKVTNNKKMPLLLSLGLALTLILAFGFLHLQSLVGGAKNGFLLGVVPFIIGDTLKAFVAYALIQYTFKKKEA